MIDHRATKVWSRRLIPFVFGCSEPKTRFLLEMWRQRISLGLILAFSQLVGVAVAKAEGAPTLLSSVKAATGRDAWNNIRSLHIRGKEIAGGMTRSREEWDD